MRWTAIADTFKNTVLQENILKYTSILKLRFQAIELKLSPIVCLYNVIACTSYFAWQRTIVEYN